MQFKDIDFDLIWRKINASLTSQEEKDFDHWINQNPLHEEYFLKVLHYYKEDKVVNAGDIDLIRGWKVLEKKLKPHSNKKTYKLFRVASVAAVFLIAIISGAVLIFNNLSEKTFVERVDIQMPPGKSLATLKIANSETIELIEGASFDNIIGSARVLNAESKLSYRSVGVKGKQLMPEIHNLEVPRGGKYFLVLQDSTKVWLNSETEIKYPSLFLAGEERIVELKGEAYFDVSKDVNRPFKVRINGQLIEVLGTQFNISSYDDEEYSRITLVEGKVKIEPDIEPSKSYYLEPGTQFSYSQATHSAIKTEVDVAYYISWINNSYLFKNKNLEDIMKTLSRWYNVDVVFEKSEIKRIPFTGEIDRVQNFEDVLEVIEKTNEVKFKSDNGKIIVY